MKKPTLINKQYLWLCHKKTGDKRCCQRV